MASFLSPKVPKPDTSAQEASLKAQEASLAAQEKTTLDAQRKQAASASARRRGGQRSLITSSEQGVTQTRQQLG